MSFRLIIAASVAFMLGATIGVQAAANLRVVQRGLKLERSTATINRGDSISFTNDDDVIHNIHIFGPGDFEKDLGLQKPGALLTYVFDKSGSVRVRCNIHPSVKMTVTVN